MPYGEEFRTQYAAALHAYLDERGEASLAVGHELGRRALADQISVLDIVENHFRLVDGAPPDRRLDASAALQFLLQTLAALDVATRGFLDGTKLYKRERARAEDLATRDAFRSALVNSLQEGFFLADHEGTVVEINDAFADITGYQAEDLPFRWPHSWVLERQIARRQMARLARTGTINYETRIRHSDGHTVWVAVSINTVRRDVEAQDSYVGTIRDITAARASAARDSAVMRLATAAGVATNVGDVLTILIDEFGTTIDLRRVLAVIWPRTEGEPEILVARASFETIWRDLDPQLRSRLEDAREWPALTVEPIASAEEPGRSRGIIAVLSGSEDTALWFEHNASRPTTSDDRLLVSALVGHLSLAIQHVRQFETAREASLTLQRAMLPSMTPPTGFAVRYEPAVPPLEIGGDWYDVLPLSGRQIGIIVGDCVGRGLPAAAVMGQLRSSARALLLTGAEPAVLLDELDSAAALIPDAYCTTVFLGILDTGTGVLRYSNAGHLPAVLVSVDNPPTILGGAVSVPLGVARTAKRPQATETLPQGSTLMMFTDGLVERRDNSIDTGIERLTDVLLDTMSKPVDAVADAVLSAMAPADGYDDDVAIVVYRRPPGPLHFDLPATVDRLREVRGRLSRWLTSAGASEDLIADILLAVNEACTNSVEHAYRDVDAGIMRVEADLRGDEITILVKDFGTWKTPDPEPWARGRGLPMMEALSEQVQLDSEPSGTTVVMSFTLPAAAGSGDGRR